MNALDKVEVSGEEEHGINLLKRSLGEPLNHIAINAGHEGDVVLRKVIDQDIDTTSLSSRWICIYIAVLVPEKCVVYLDNSINPTLSAAKAYYKWNSYRKN
jgi:hypothetical protein